MTKFLILFYTKVKEPDVSSSFGSVIRKLHLNPYLYYTLKFKIMQSLSSKDIIF